MGAYQDGYDSKFLTPPSNLSSFDKAEWEKGRRDRLDHPEEYDALRPVLFRSSSTEADDTPLQGLLILFLIFLLFIGAGLLWLWEQIKWLWGQIRHITAAVPPLIWTLVAVVFCSTITYLIYKEIKSVTATMLREGSATGNKEPI